MKSGNSNFKAILILCSIFINFQVQVYCQSENEIVKGGYRNVVEFKKNDPSFKCDFTYSKKKHKKIPELYDVTATNSEIDDYAINRVIWGIL